MNMNFNFIFSTLLTGADGAAARGSQRHSHHSIASPKIGSIGRMRDLSAQIISPKKSIEALKSIKASSLKKAHMIARKMEYAMGKKPLAPRTSFGDRIQELKNSSRDIKELEIAAERLAKLYRECSVAHLQFASALQDVGHHSPELEEKIILPAVRQACQKMSMASTSFASKIEAVSAEAAALARRQAQAARQADHVHGALRTAEVALDVDCIEYERWLNRTGGARTAVTPDTVAAAIAAEDRSYSSPLAARVAAAEESVIKDFNMTQQLQAELVTLTKVFTPSDVSQCILHRVLLVSPSFLSI